LRGRSGPTSTMVRGEPANSCAVSLSARSAAAFSRWACGSFRSQTPSPRLARITFNANARSVVFGASEGCDGERPLAALHVQNGIASPAATSRTRVSKRVSSTVSHATSGWRDRKRTARSLAGTSKRGKSTGLTDSRRRAAMLAAMPRDRRPTGNRLLLAALLLLVLAALFYALWDRAIAEWAFHLPRSWANAARRLSALGEGVYWIVVAFAIGLTGVVRKKEAVAAWALETIVAIAGSGIAANVLKVVAGRARPRALDEGVWGFHFFEFGYRFNSFPSGHAAIAGAVAASICLAFPAAWPAAAFLWILLAGGRVGLAEADPLALGRLVEGRDQLLVGLLRGGIGDERELAAGAVAARRL